MIKIDQGASVPFCNNAAFCVGTGRIHLALRHEYHKQLQKVQEEIGFKYIRGHGLFCDDMAVFNTFEEDGVEKVEYNFTYLDMVFDDYLSLGLKPFVELGFMPGKMASGEQTVFYWEGNVTPPRDYKKWADLAEAAILHWFERYGRGEVLSWLFEVWNEPNLAVFWKDADMEEYFKLYDVTSRAVKRCDPKLRVGGPAICGVDDERWLRLFLEFCAREKVPLDFVTRHAYATELPERDGRYAYQELRTPEVFLGELAESRRIIDSFKEFRGMEMHLTEFNTSYTPQCPLHDTNLNAAYIARLLSELGDTCASYSYWTFGDVFEESGVAFTPFSGGFGLLANGSVPKPTFWAFAFFNKLGSDAAARGENYVVTKDGAGGLRGVAWNPAQTRKTLPFSFELEKGTYMLVQRTVDEECCNPLKAWIDMGSPPTPTKEQNQLLIECAAPRVSTRALTVEGSFDWELQLSENALCCFEIRRVAPQTDRGYHPERVRGAR